MSYIVVKMIKGNPYLYQVRGERVGNRIKQVYEKYLGRANTIDMKEGNMEDAFTTEEVTQVDANWQTLRSEIYNRDNGMCWICNKFVELKDYELGHLVDRCNGGQDIYENLAAMHESCNQSKPKHNTLEEAIVWKLKTRFLTNERSSALFGDAPQPRTYSYPKTANYPKPIPQTINGDNELKMEALKLISKILDNPVTASSKGLFPSRPRMAQPSNSPIKQKPNYMNCALHPRTIEHIKQRHAELESMITSDMIYVCWIQGRPLGGPMWRVSLPPYDQSHLFTTRLTPPGAVDNSKKGVRETIQVIGGTLTKELHFDSGVIHFTITPNGTTKPSITFSHTSLANCKDYNKSVGLGVGQIPIHIWKQAKAQGITFPDFISQYEANHTQES